MKFLNKTIYKIRIWSRSESHVTKSLKINKFIKEILNRNLTKKEVLSLFLFIPIIIVGFIILHYTLSCSNYDESIFINYFSFLVIVMFFLSIL